MTDDIGNDPTLRAEQCAEFLEYGGTDAVYCERYPYHRGRHSGVVWIDGRRVQLTWPYVEPKRRHRRADTGAVSKYPEMSPRDIAILGGDPSL